MTDPLGLTGEAHIVANQIRSIDQDLDDLERKTEDSIISGLHSSGAAMGANLGQIAADEKHARLLAERAELVVRLKALVGNR